MVLMALLSMPMKLLNVNNITIIMPVPNNYYIIYYIALLQCHGNEILALADILSSNIYTSNWMIFVPIRKVFSTCIKFVLFIRLQYINR